MGEDACGDAVLKKGCAIIGDEEEFVVFGGLGGCKAGVVLVVARQAVARLAVAGLAARLAAAVVAGDVGNILAKGGCRDCPSRQTK